MQYSMIFVVLAVGLAAGSAVTPKQQTINGVSQLISVYFKNSSIGSFLDIITADCYNQTSNSDIMTAVVNKAMGCSESGGLVGIAAKLHNDMPNDFDTAYNIILDVLAKKGYPILNKMKKKAKKEQKAGAKSKADIINDEYNVALKYLTSSYVKGTFTALQKKITKKLNANDWQIIVNDLYTVLLFSNYGYTQQG